MVTPMTNTRKRQDIKEAIMYQKLYNPVDLLDTETAKDAVMLQKRSITIDRIRDFANEVLEKCPDCKIGIKFTSDWQWGIRDRRYNEGIVLTRMARYGKKGVYDSYIWLFAIKEAKHEGKN